MPEDELSPESHLQVLRYGRVEVLGRIPWGSNATLLTEVYVDPEGDEGEDTPEREPALKAVYKPRRGERPLWDFPGGLDRREVAAYELSTALGWGIVPETVLRDDLPFGVGSLQRFVPFVAEDHYLTLIEDPAYHETLQTICCFDLISNQADRKAGHCLRGEDKRIWAVDNGLAFHHDLKLRTVIWDFAGMPIPDRLREDLTDLDSRGLPAKVADLLDEPEQAALTRRIRSVVNLAGFPDDPSGRRYPWPPI